MEDGERKSSVDDDDLQSKFRLRLPIFWISFPFSFSEIVNNNNNSTV